MHGQLARQIHSPFFEAGETTNHKTKLHGFTVEALRRQCAPAEWREIEHDTAVLETFARSSRESVQIDSGECPERFTAAATCAQCGDVWVPVFQAGNKVAGGRWCAARERGEEIPRPRDC